MLSATPHVGWIGLLEIHGPDGKLIEWGERLNGDGAGAVVQHAVICIDASRWQTDGTVDAVGALPFGAAVQTFTPADNGLWWAPDGITDDRLNVVAQAARKYIGTPYSFLDYAAIAAHRYRIPVPLLKGYIASTKHMICSQLAVQCYKDAGIDLFPERWDGYVTPAELWDMATEGR